jgi:CDGSH-type Zn-finger protein
MAPKISILKNGPYLVTGNVPLSRDTIESNPMGVALKWSHGATIPTGDSYALCRCGHSGAKPLCDGSHSTAGFIGLETADRAPYSERAETFVGPALVLTDAIDLCAGARFCDRAGGVWNLTNQSADPVAREKAIQEACDCPAGRLVARDKETGVAIEPVLEKSISLIEDPAAKASGPIWVKGGIPVESAKGELYETRNRVTLCRCGASSKKPFCDGAHIPTHFSESDNPTA